MTDQRHQLRKAQPRPERSTFLPPDRAFVLQLRAEASVAADHVVGRVERVATGEAVQFSSLAELMRFLARALDES